MAEQAGNLHWNRQRITLSAGVTDVDTGLITSNRAYGPLEPPLGVEAASSPPAGALPASRVNVIPMAPLSQWSGVAHGEPYVSTVDGHVHVAFENSNEGEVEINVLFWNPHTILSPGQAEPYNSEGICCESLAVTITEDAEPALEGEVTVTFDNSTEECTLDMVSHYTEAGVNPANAGTWGTFVASLEAAGFTVTVDPELDDAALITDLSTSAVTVQCINNLLTWPLVIPEFNVVVSGGGLTTPAVFRLTRACC